MKTKPTKKSKKVNIVSLGCSKNLVDSEQIAAQLEQGDYEVDIDGVTDKIVVINTCGFIDNAKEESVNTILHYAALKEEGKIDNLVVTGCLSERYKDDLKGEIPEVDAFFGTQDMPDLVDYFDVDYKHELIGETRHSGTPNHYAYLKISEGCNRTCSFCAIPLMRGKHKSKTIEQIVNEAQVMAANGVKEIMLIAQELTYYGLDVYKKRMLPALLDQLCEVEGIEWIRLHYAYPQKFPMDIIETMKTQPKICNYLDIPLQHVSNSMLTGMKRQITKETTVQLIQDIRKLIPTIAIRTTFLIGFPGETDEDIEELKEFIEETQFERVGIFQYSHEEGTSAYEVEDNVSAEDKNERMQYLMEVQRDISFGLNQDKIGQEIKVLVDRKDGEYFVGRSEYDSPEVDNEVLIPVSNTEYVRIGDFVTVKIEDATEYDLIGSIVHH